jgi:hypothetical protein
VGWAAKEGGVGYCASRKNCCVPEIGLVTVYCSLTATGAGRLVVQAVEPRFMVDCKTENGVAQLVQAAKALNGVNK